MNMNHVESKSNLATIFENHPVATHFSPKKMQKVLQGLQSQIDRLKNQSEKIFSQQKEEAQKKWNVQIEEINGMLQQCERSIIPLIKKPSYISDIFNMISTQTESKSNKTYDVEAIEKTNDVDILESIREHNVSKKNAISFTLFELNDNSNKRKKKIHEEKDKIDINNENKIDVCELLKTRARELFQFEQTINPFFGKITTKIEKLKKQIGVINQELKEPNSFSEMLWSLAVRIEKCIPTNYISEKIRKFSKDQNQIIIEKKANLFRKYQEALHTLVQYNEYIYKKLLEYTFLPKIEEFQNRIDKKNEYFNDLLSSLKKININVLASGFDPKFGGKLKPDQQTVCYHRDFSNFLEEAKKYAELKKNFEMEREELATLDAETKDLFSQLSAKLFEASKRIELLNKGKTRVLEDHADNSSNGKEIVLLTGDSYGPDLKKILAKIEKKWNQCHWDLFKLDHQAMIFNRFSDVIENMSLCFVLGEDIYETLRHDRKNNDFKSEHIKLCDDMRREFTILTNLLGQTCEQEQSNPNVLDGLFSNSSIFNELLNLFKNDQSEKDVLQEGALTFVPSKLSFILTSNCQHLHDLKIPETSKIFDNNRWHNCVSFTPKEETICDLVLKHLNKSVKSEEETISDQAEKLQQDFEREFKEYKEQVISSFKDKLKLNALCDHIVAQFDKELKAHSHSAGKPYYDYKFTEAFFADSVLGDAGQTVLSLGNSAIRFVGTQIVKSFSKENVEQLPENAPFDSDRLVNPFTTMKLTF